MSRYIDIHTHNFTASHTELRAVGIHPWDADKATLCEELFRDAQAIGEIGLDFACDVSRAKQEELFRLQLTIAEQLGVPVVLHCVRAFARTLEILKEHKLRGVIFHGFIGSKEQMMQAVKRGYFISYGEGVLRSPKSAEALRHTPLENLFLETDVSKKTIEEIYQIAARITGYNLETITSSITNNYNRLFQL